MTVLITRAQEDGKELSKKIEALGIPVLHEPLIEFDIYDQKYMHDYSSYDAFIFTSRAAVKYLQACDYKRFLNTECFVIGDKTADMLGEMGFVSVFSAKNDMDTLLQKVIEMSPQKPLYFRGENISYDLYDALKRHGINCDEEICYNVEYAKSLSSKALDKLKSGEVKTILLFSKNTADAFLNLCKQYSVEKILKKATILAISEDLKVYLSNKLRNKVETFEGNENSLLELIKSYYV